MKKYLFTTLALGILTFFLAPNVSAQTELPCGNITAPANWQNNFDPEESLETKPITNCQNPFGVTDAGPSPDTLFIASNQVFDTDVIEIPTVTTSDYNVRFDYSNNFISHQAILFKHAGANYEYVSIEQLPPTEEDYRVLANEFFTDPNDVDDAVQRIMSADPWSGLEYGSDAFIKIDNFDRFVRINLPTKLPPLNLGTYTLVFRLGELFPTWHETVLKKFAQFFVPVAYAASPGTYKITFTLKNPTPSPAGASSVLFLPGIMGSRLYEDTNFCDSESGETELWLTRSTCKQLRLSTSFTGASIHNLYTKSDPGSVIDEGFGFNLYKTFITSLKGWKSSGVITDYTLVPYDWRLRLDDLLKTKLDTTTGKITYSPSNTVQDGYVYKALGKLVASSTTGKVTIVAHSNGGLLAKALLIHLKITNDPLLSKVDNLIMVGSPQLGTPNTLLGMLHGDVIGPLGSVVSQETTRTLMNTMPFAYHLLPSADYFNGVGATVQTPVIIFENGAITTPLANTFGSTITTAPVLQSFLSNSSGRVKPDVADLATPEVVDNFLFSYSNTIHQLLNNWTPPTTMKVYQIAGIGLPTMSGLTYFTDQECATRSFLIYKCATYKPKLGMRPNETIDGDGTVVTPSALGMSTSQDGVERLWLNLKNYNNDSVFNRYHSDIFEVQDIINFVKNTIEATTSAPYLYLTDTAPSLPNENRLVFDLHSPLDLSIVTADGGVISSSSVTVEGAQYKRFGEIQHISMLNTSSKKTVKLNGTATGSFTLEIGEQLGTAITKRHTYSAIPTSTSTKVTIDLDSVKPIEQSVVSVDYDGNGTPEIAYNTAGEILPVTTYTTLTTAINKLTINTIYKKLLLENAKIAEGYQLKSLTQTKFNKLEILALNVLKQQVTLYERLKVLTSLQRQELVGIIDKLIIK